MIFNEFPKVRPALPEAYQAIYNSHYKENRDGSSVATGMAQRLEQWMHFQIAKDVKHSSSNNTTLEIGAGTLNHLKYEPNVSTYDIVEPFLALYEKNPTKDRIRHFYNDITDITGDNLYDRIISIAAFEHICNLPEVVARAGLLLKENGQLRVAIPNEGTWLWTLGWKLTTGIEFKLKYNLDYRIFLANEHVNTAKEIESVLSYFFDTIDDSFLGIGRSSAFYRCFFCANVNKQRCKDYLAQLKK